MPTFSLPFLRSHTWVLTFAVLLLTACSNSSSNEEPPTPEVADFTFLVYIAADNQILADLSAFARQDIEEMKRGLATVDDTKVHLLVYADIKKETPRLFELTKVNGQVEEKLIKEYAQRNSCGVQEMQEVIDEVMGKKAFEAKRYALVFWSHGDGWIPSESQTSTRWIGQDVTNGTHYMKIDELVSILANYPKMEFVMFDACFMLSIEVAYALREQANYIIGCPTETPGPGADYARVIPVLFQGDSQLALKVAEAFYQPYEENYLAGDQLSDNKWTKGAAIGAIQTSGLNQLATLTKQCLAKAVQPENLARTTFCYDRRSTSDSFFVGYYDMVELMKQLLTESDYAVWKTAYDAVLPYWQHTPMNYSDVFKGMFSMERANGISHYIPRSDRTKAAASYRQTDWYKDAGLSQLGW